MSRHPETGPSRQPTEVTQRVFVGILGENGLALTKYKGRAADPDGLPTQLTRCISTRSFERT